MLLNLYLHHHLDRPWRKLHPDVPLVRVADDILVLCQTTREARQARTSLATLLKPAAMPLKGEPGDGVRRLTEQEPADWLGFRIRRQGRKLHVGLAESAWRRLEDHLAWAAERPDPVARAGAVLGGWLGQQGPCYPHLDRDDAYARIAAMSKRRVGKTPDRDCVFDFWQRAYARWCKLRSA